MKKYKTNPDLFPGGADLPLFSGVSQTVVVAEYKIRERELQFTLFIGTCPICYGTGMVNVVKNRKMVFCICAAGARARGGCHE